MTLYREYNELPQHSPTNCSWPGGVFLGYISLRASTCYQLCRTRVSLPEGILETGQGGCSPGLKSSHPKVMLLKTRVKLPETFSLVARNPESCLTRKQILKISN